MGNEGTEHLLSTYCVQGIFPAFSLSILTITLQSPQFAEEEPEAQKGLCLTQGCRADKKGLHLNLVLSALSTSGNSRCHLGTLARATCAPEPGAPLALCLTPEGPSERH